MASEQSGDRSRKVADTSGEPDAGDDLDSLAGSLGSLPPPDGDDGELDLRALSALSVRSSSVVESRDAGVVRLDGALDAVSAAPSHAPSAPAVVMESTDAGSWSVPPPASRRASWVTPLFIGLSLGIGVAGLAFGLSQMGASGPVPAASAAPAAPTPTSLVSSTGATPAAAEPPVAPGAPPATAAPALASAAAPTAEVEPTLVEPTPAEIAAAKAAAAPARPAARGGATASPASGSAEPVVLRSPTPAEGSPAASSSPVLALRPAEAATPPASATPEAPAPQAAAKRGTSVDDLLDQALASPERREAMRKEEAAAQVKDALPETPSREDVTKAMTTMLPAISGCAMGHSGLATATIVVRGDGRVANAEVAGAPFAGTASGRCMEGVIRRATFPRFRQPVFRIKFPLSIR